MSKIIAVSSYGFSKGAKRLARCYGIDLRTIEAIEPDDIVDWCHPSKLHMIVRCSKIATELQVDMTGQEHLLEALRVHVERVKPNVTPILGHPKIDGKLTTQDVWQVFLGQNTHLFDGLEPNGEHRHLTLPIEYAESDRYYIFFEDKRVPIRRIVFQAELWLTDQLYSAITQYAHVTGTQIARSVQYKIVMDNGDVALNVTVIRK